MKSSAWNWETPSRFTVTSSARDYATSTFHGLLDHRDLVEKRMQALHSAWGPSICGTAPDSDDLMMPLTDPHCTHPQAMLLYRNT